MMGGDITAESGIGRGSVFRFRIRAGKGPVARPGRRVTALEPGQPRYRILIADDEESNRLLLLGILALPGFELREAGDGGDAVRIWEEWEPHLILMDMRMPVMDGYEATKRIKGTAAGRATPVIAVTAGVFGGERAEILSAGCDDLVCKPFTESEIFDVMHRHAGVRFVCEDHSPEPAGEQDRTPLTAEALSVLPAELGTDIEQAILSDDQEGISELTERIRGQDTALADALDRAVDNFEHERILTLLQKSRKLGG